MASESGRFLVGVLVGAILGGGAAYLAAELGGGAAAPAGSSSTGVAPGDAVETGAGRPDVAPLPDASSREVVRTVPASASRAVEVSDGEIAGLLASAEAPEIEPANGEGVIFGKVTDGEGAGVDGVVLRAQRRSRDSRAASPADVGAGVPELQSLEEAVRDAVERYSESRSGLFETATDASGSYRFADLPEGPWRITAYKEDHVVESQSNAYEVAVGSEIDFVAKPVITVPATVYTMSGKLAREAVLSCKGQGRSTSRYRWSAEEAYLRLAPGTYEITALSSDASGRPSMSEDDAEQKSEEQRVVLKAGETPAALRFDLKGRLGIRGLVKFPNDGIKGSNPRVHLLALAPGEELDLEQLAESDKSEWARSGREYNFLDLDPGRYAVGVARTWSSPIVAHREVEVSDGIARCDLALPPLDPSEFLRATVIGPDGAMVDDVDFSYRYETERMSSSGGSQALQDRDGVYLISFNKDFRESYFSDDTEFKYTLTAEHGDLGSKSAELQPGQMEVTITLAPPAELEVTIAGYQGSGYEGKLQVSAEPIGDAQGRTYWYGGNRNRISPTGVKKLESLTPGRYSVSLWLDESGRRGWGGPGNQIDRIEVQVASGANYATLTIPALYSFDVHWADGKEGANLSLNRIGADEDRWWGAGQATLDAQGVARFENITAGDYTLQAWGGKSLRMQISVPCKTVEFQPMVVDAMWVVITDESGDLARLGFLSGDLIIGTGGREFEDEPDYNLFSSLYSSKSARVTFLVDRAGEQLEIEVKGTDVGDWATLGGNLEPTSR